MKTFKLFTAFLLSLCVLGAEARLTNADLQRILYFPGTNLGFENGKTGWTNSNGTFDITTSLTDVGEGSVSGSFNAASSGDYLITDAINVEPSKVGLPCNFTISVKGDASLYNLQLVNSADDYVYSTTSGLSNSSYTKYGLETLSCPAIVKFKLIATGDGALVYIDSGKLNTDSSLIKNLTDTQHIRYTALAGYGSTNNKIPYFTNAVANEGSQIVTVENSSVNGFSITANRKCRVQAFWSPSYSASMSNGWTLNSANLTTGITNLVSEVVAATLVTNNNIWSITPASIEMEAGDVLRPHANTNQGTGSYPHILEILVEAESEHVVTPAKSAIEEVYYDGYASKDGSGNIKFKTAQRNTLSKVASVDNTTYTKFTALKKVFVIAKTTGQSASVASVNLRHYNNQNIQLSVSKYVTAVTYTQTATLPILMNPGDYLLVNTNEAMGDQVATNFSAVFVDFEQQILSAIPTQQTCYIKDVKAYNATGGNTSAGTYYVRDLNVINETGSNTSSSCSFATLNGSNQFTLQAGTYDFSAKVPFYSCNTAVAFLRDTSAGTNDVYGGINAQSYLTTTTGVSGLIPLAGRLTLSSAKTFEVKMYAESTRTAGLGQPAGVSGISSVYTQVEITKIK